MDTNVGNKIEHQLDPSFVQSPSEIFQRIISSKNGVDNIFLDGVRRSDYVFLGVVGKVFFELLQTTGIFGVNVLESPIPQRPDALKRMMVRNSTLINCKRILTLQPHHVDTLLFQLV